MLPLAPFVSWLPQWAQRNAHGSFCCLVGPLSCRDGKQTPITVVKWSDCTWRTERIGQNYTIRPHYRRVTP